MKTASQRRPKRSKTAAFLAKVARRKFQRSHGLTPSKLEAKAQELLAAKLAAIRRNEGFDQRKWERDYAESVGISAAK